MRLEGWEARLAAVVEEARVQPYELGVHDCLRVACQAVEALIGVDHWPRWAGSYSTRRGALLVIHRYAGGGLAEATTKFLGCEAVAAKLARRGDILEYVDAESHLGVCVGSRVAVLGEAGLAFVRHADCRHAWRIG